LRIPFLIAIARTPAALRNLDQSGLRPLGDIDSPGAIGSLGSLGAGGSGSLAIGTTGRGLSGSGRLSTIGAGGGGSTGLGCTESSRPAKVSPNLEVV